MNQRICYRFELFKKKHSDESDEIAQRLLYQRNSVQKLNNIDFFNLYLFVKFYLFIFRDIKSKMNLNTLLCYIL